MTDNSTQARMAAELQQLWHSHFPLSKAMDVRVQDFDGRRLTTRTTLQANTNIHGSAFAGSLYAIQALTAWGILYLQLQHLQLDASIIHASGRIDFARPVLEDIVAGSELPLAELDADSLRANGKLRLQLAASVTTADGRSASSFSGDYAVRLNR